MCQTFGTKDPTDLSDRICETRSLASSPTCLLPSLTNSKAVGSAARADRPAIATTAVMSAAQNPFRNLIFMAWDDKARDIVRQWRKILGVGFGRIRSVGSTNDTLNG